MIARVLIHPRAFATPAEILDLAARHRMRVVSTNRGRIGLVPQATVIELKPRLTPEPTTPEAA